MKVEEGKVEIWGGWEGGVLYGMERVGKWVWVDEGGGGVEVGGVEMKEWGGLG